MRDYILRVRGGDGVDQWITVTASSQADARKKVAAQGYGLITIGVYDDIDDAQTSNPRLISQINSSNFANLNEVAAGNKLKMAELEDKGPSSENLWADYAMEQADLEGFAAMDQLEKDDLDIDALAIAQQQEAQRKAEADAIAKKQKEVEDALKLLDESTSRPQDITAPYQTELSRRQALEETGDFGFASFLDELEKAGLGGLQGSAGRFMQRQFSPLSQAYQAEQILPLAGGGVPFGQDMQGMSQEQQQGYREALRRQHLGDYIGADDPQRILDEEEIARRSPTFGEYTSGALQAGGRQAQQRIGQQLQSLSQINMEGQAPDSFTSRMLAPADRSQASFLSGLANQALRGRFSPLAMAGLDRFLPDEDELYANYQRRATPMAGADIRTQTPPNFAQFIGQQYGLY